MKYFNKLKKLYNTIYNCVYNFYIHIRTLMLLTKPRN